MQSKIRVGTRKSELALTQTNLVKESLLSSGYQPEIHPIVTTGDKDLRPFQSLLGDGFFTKEIEKSLLSNEVDLAVHSSKDLPSQLHKELPWVAYSEREDTTDILIVKKEFVLSKSPLKLKDGILLGTSSPRRTAQLKRKFPQSKIVSIRGNVQRRIERITLGEVDATVLAKAGVNRLNLYNSIKASGLEIIDLDFVTAPCQGILAVQGNSACKKALEALNNKELTDIALAEKSVLAMLGGGCHLAVGCKISKSQAYQMDFFLSEQDSMVDYQLEGQNLDELLRQLFAKLSHSNATHPRVISTQPMQHQLTTARKLAQAGFQPTPWIPREILPVFSHADFEEVHKNFLSFDALVFTSRFSVRIFMNEFIAMRSELLTTLSNIKIFAVGEGTRKELQNYGNFDVVLPESAHAGSLIKILDAKNPLFMGTSDSAPIPLMKEHGKNYKFLRLYGSFANTKAFSQLPSIKEGDKLVLSNPLCAKDFIELYKQNTSLFKHLKIYAFGPSTSRILKEENIPHLTNPKSGSWDEMINLLKQ